MLGRTPAPAQRRTYLARQWTATARFGLPPDGGSPAGVGDQKTLRGLIPRRVSQSSTLRDPTPSALSCLTTPTTAFQWKNTPLSPPAPRQQRRGGSGPILRFRLPRSYDGSQRASLLRVLPSRLREDAGGPSVAPDDRLLEYRSPLGAVGDARRNGHRYRAAPGGHGTTSGGRQPTPAVRASRSPQPPAGDFPRGAVSRPFLYLTYSDGHSGPKRRSAIALR